MIESYLRPRYQKAFVDPVAKKVSNFLSPNFVTFVACLCGIAVFPAVYFQQYGAACFILLLSGYFDTLDGTIARLKGDTSPTGSVFDITADRIVELVVIFSLLYVDPISRAIPAFWMLGSILLCVTAFLVVGIFSENTSNKGFFYSQGIMERVEAFAFFILMLLYPEWFSTLAWIFSSLVILTAFIHVFCFWKASKTAD
ncbi:MAG: CDP-alcohol phosphatidyltransferase family protein [Alphaproteobacteria bacterium]|jgi:archaetidylinositol phosphate synthase|nr:CDP-alcohol phosphatidyltransferase family protein [Alphaproteobacteria bacterium]MBT5390487.1 CDP-alcohol phosphatidyltransferase family protein [Alphaproteobacteria bacterium]MBT5654743.1 CDP-alcohol phosphatidyltransferase family protein [Alphaproteobacteria bacterium]